MGNKTLFPRNPKISILWNGWNKVIGIKSLKTPSLQSGTYWRLLNFQNRNGEPANTNQPFFGIYNSDLPYLGTSTPMDRTGRSGYIPFSYTTNMVGIYFQSHCNEFLLVNSHG